MGNNNSHTHSVSMRVGDFEGGVIWFSHESESRRHVAMSWQLYRDAY